MNPDVNPNRYWRQGAVAASDLNTTLAPKPVCESAAKLAAAIEAREDAEQAWKAAMAATFPSEAEAKRTAAARDASGKAAVGLARDHARTVVESATDWVAAIDVALQEKVDELELLVTAVEAALVEFDTLKSVRLIPVQTTNSVLERYRARVFTGHARDGVAQLKRWLHPPVIRRSPVRARNFGQNLMSRDARDFVAREE